MNTDPSGRMCRVRFSLGTWWAIVQRLRHQRSAAAIGIGRLLEERARVLGVSGKTDAAIDLEINSAAAAAVMDAARAVGAVTPAPKHQSALPVSPTLVKERLAAVAEAERIIREAQRQ